MTAEKKRKLPARASARGESAAKKRSIATPSTDRSLTPAPMPSAEQSPGPTPQQQQQQQQQPPLPTSIQNGKPLPTVETPQPEDLAVKDYQTIQESGVLAESLTRSRKLWMEGLFEKYWTKPSKKKGAVEDAKNPSRDTMTKIGTVTIKIEPLSLEATMFAVRDLKAATATSTVTSTPTQHASAFFRPILQYGPPGGELPPPPPPAPVHGKEPDAASKPSTPVAAAQWPPQYLAPSQPSASPLTPTTPAMPAAAQTVAPAASIAIKQETSRPPTISSLGSTQHALQSPHTVNAPASILPPGQPVTRTPSNQSAAAVQLPVPPPTAQSPRNTPSSQSTPGATGGSGKPNDPIIATLAEKASADPQLREIMKKVAGGSANPDELATFQRVIDRITVEYRRRNTPFVPPDVLLVDGKSVAYYASEVRSIVEVVLGSHPQQRGNTLRAPHGVNPLIMAVVKEALDNIELKDAVIRIANNKARNTDPADLKDTLERLSKELPRLPSGTTANVVNGHTRTPTHSTSSAQEATQAVRSKAPPKQQEFSALVFEFAAGNGDRYLFPKFSILKYEPSQNEVLASFLLVRKGSVSDKEGDPALDYWEPVTIRIIGKHAENLRHVVAPEADVRQYMDSIKRTMTRAEFVILATRLPRDKDDKDERKPDESAKSTPKPDGSLLLLPQGNSGVLWAAKPNKPSAGSATGSPSASLIKRVGTGGDDDKQQARYLKFINTVAGKEPEMA